MENTTDKIANINKISISISGAFKVKNYENMARINSLLTLDNYEMRRQLIEWKSELESNNNSYERLRRDVAKCLNENINEKEK